MKVVVFTLGCKVNQYESNSLIAGLIRLGHEVTDELCPADLYIVNTCAVTAEAEKKSRQMVSRIKKHNENARIIFTGCAAQKNPEAFLSKDNVQLVTGVYSKSEILNLLEESGKRIFEENGNFENTLPAHSLRSRTFIKVQDGCNNFCSYCIVPYLRGRSRSRSPESIIFELGALGPKEAVINGINLSAYNYEGQDLADLITALKGIDARIRLGSLEVNVICDRFLKACANLNNFARHFHLSLQSGSDKVLKDMNRHYTTEEYAEKVELIRKYFPDAGITTDVIVGFPTEGENEFFETVDFVKRIGFSEIHCFNYSPRSGTKAYSLKDLDPEIKKRRLDILLKTAEELKMAFIAKNIGATQDFLPEEINGNFAEGYLNNYIRAYMEGEYEDKIINVKIIKPYLDGVLVIKEDK